MIEERFFPDRLALIEHLSNSCEKRLRDAVASAGKASFMVSGGSTPAPLYRELATRSLPWDKVTIGLVDERWVPVGHDKSNQRFVQENLLQSRARDACYIGMINESPTAADGLANCEQAYQELTKPWDLTLLGMGGDGHTASLFPHSQGLDSALDANSTRLCAAITAQRSEVTGDFTERMSLSLTGLLQSRVIYLLITGDEKLDVYRQALDGNGEQKSLRDMPIRAVLQQQEVPVVVYWAP